MTDRDGAGPATAETVDEARKIVGPGKLDGRSSKPNSDKPQATAARSWRDVLPIHPAAELGPLMSPDDLRDTGESIKKNGMTSPIVVGHRDKYDREFKLWDGRNRLDALEALGLLVFECDDDSGAPAAEWLLHFFVEPGMWPVPVKVLREDKGNDPYAYVKSANVHRLHLTNEQKRELIAKLLKATPGQSNRMIAEQIKTDHHTVAAVRDRLQSTGEIPQLEKTPGKDGKERPAKAKSKTPKSAVVREPNKIPPMPKFTREQIGAPPEGTENEQDPDSPPGVTRAQARTRKYGHVHIRPLNEKLRADKEKKVTSFVAALRNLIRPSEELLRHSIEPEEFLATLREMKGKSMLHKFEERMTSIERLVAYVNAINALRVNASDGLLPDVNAASPEQSAGEMKAKFAALDSEGTEL